MRPKPPQLSPADRRALAADLLARRLLDLASRGILLELEDAGPADRSTETSERPGARAEVELDGTR